ncbi:ThiF family adenylyltransferase [Streptomyces liangshanensis]|uniref:ThiF family adenylyltransferase n=1 Tax=Streptomyces liangshanensis TaxID=2717324 RepID=UPI001FBC1422|nr:ThiF family adenylyltransferase [Streptomyces liangshanensis]
MITEDDLTEDTAGATPPAATVGGLSPDEFYAELTTRNRGVVSAAEQDALRTSTVLVAGCGSIGGAAVEPLVRLGARNFLLADPGEYEVNNLNRQSATAADTDRNKALVASERILGINPHAKTAVFTQGVGEDTIEQLTADCQVIVDGIDVTTMSGWRAKHLLHRTAVARKLPLVTGWDIAGAQYVRCYDYRTVRKPFDGAISQSDIEELTSWQLLLKAIPLRYVPVEMLTEVKDNLGRPDYSFPQVTYVALTFGAITSHMVVKLLAGEQVRPEVYIDVHQEIRSNWGQLATRLRWVGELASLAPKLLKLSRGAQA